MGRHLKKVNALNGKMSLKSLSLLHSSHIEQFPHKMVLVVVVVLEANSLIIISFLK